MKNILFLFLVFALTSCSIIGNEFSFVKKYRVTSPISLTLSTTGGGIKVRGTQNDSVIVKFIVEKNNIVQNITLDELDQFAEYEISTDENSIYINIKKTKQHAVNIGFDVETPEATTAHLNTGGGGMDVENLAGNLQCNTGGGGISIKDIKGDVKANTGGGGISIGNVNGSAIVNTGGGGVNAWDISHGLEANTGGGGMNIKNVNEGVDVNTGGGGISLKGVSGSISANTGGGSITVTAEKVENYIKLSTGGGGISIDIPVGGYNLDIEGERIHTNLAHFNGTSKQDYISGTVRGGGPSIEVKTSSGTVDLNFK